MIDAREHEARFDRWNPGAGFAVINGVAFVAGAALLSQCDSATELAGAILLLCAGMALAAAVGFKWGSSLWPELGLGWIYIPLVSVALGAIAIFITGFIAVEIWFDHCFELSF